jgi:hypothetical protein
MWRSLPHCSKQPAFGPLAAVKARGALAIGRRDSTDGRSHRSSTVKHLIALILSLPHAPLPQSIENVVQLPTKLRIARKCVSKFTIPFDREVWSDLVQFSQAQLCLLQSPGRTVSRDQIYIGEPEHAVHIDRPPAFFDCCLIIVEVQVCIAASPTPTDSGTIPGAEAES